MPLYNFASSSFLPNAMTLYVTQWLKVASGERVYIANHVSGMNMNFTVFKCKECQDNLHVGDENFADDKIPASLQKWVSEHRHVCQKFMFTNGLLAPYHDGLCNTCHWPYGAHEESWLADPKNNVLAPVNPEGTLQNQKWMMVTVEAAKSAAMKLYEERLEQEKKETAKLTLPEFTGRVFR
jgi:hypothetical protein